MLTLSAQALPSPRRAAHAGLHLCRPGLACRGQARQGRGPPRYRLSPTAAANGEASGAYRPEKTPKKLTATVTVAEGDLKAHPELTMVNQEVDGPPRKVDWTWQSYRDGSDYVHTGTAEVEQGFKSPGAVFLNKTKGDQQYIRSIRLDTDDFKTDFPINSWLSREHGQRAFFSGTFLPKHTPNGLKDLRKEELKKMRVEQLENMHRGDVPQPLEGTDRAYGYQVYDDLGKAEGKPPNKGDRLTLGGNSQRPYPRHLSNREVGGKDGGEPWLPQDEKFDDIKRRGYKQGPFEVALPALWSLASTLSLDLKEKFKFSSYAQLMGFFKNKSQDGKRSLSNTGEDVDGYLEEIVDAAFDDIDAEAFMDEMATSRTGGISFNKEDFRAWLMGLVQFNAPRVLAGRSLDVVLSDEEYGRQFLAGMNPCMLVALTDTPALQFKSAIEAKHVDKELKKLGGNSCSLDKLVADAKAGHKPRLFMVDYGVFDELWTMSADAENRTEHAGRALFFLKESEKGEEEALLPLAFELKHRKTANMEVAEGRKLADGQGVVYSRQELLSSAHPGREALWILAKAVFRSMDSGYHQLVSHWLRCHACLEPFAIALHRQLSPMHPVFRLMLPHFRFTLNMNFNARSNLINANGIIERCFTPGVMAMPLSAVAYRDWRFSLQALPEDLKARGMLNEKGKPHLSDYPYAEDGLELWGVLETYFKKYLRRYYPKDADVEDDEELQSWWSEVKTKGHPDLVNIRNLSEEEVWGFAGPISTVEVLVRVLTTIAWTASAQHAAVNFGQYDYSSLLLNFSSMVRRPIPRPPRADGNAGPAVYADAQAEAEAYKNLTTKTEQALEEELLSYLADPLSLIFVMVTVKLLSTHHEGEQTLDMPNVLLTDLQDKGANKDFIERLLEVEEHIQIRNADKSKWTRCTIGKGKDSAMNYTLLQPRSNKGITMKGVPYSVSI